MDLASLMHQSQGTLGIAVILILCVLLSENRRALPKPLWIGGALLMQLVLAFIITGVPAVWAAVTYANGAIDAVQTATFAGSSYIFGYLGGAKAPFVLAPGESAPLVIAFQILPLVIVFSALSALLWHWRVLPGIARGISWLLRRTLGVSGTEGLGAGATLFLGVVETPLVLRGLFETASRSQLFAVMVLIMSTISGTVLGLYATTLTGVIPNPVGHMITASIISLPAGLLVARLMVPRETASEEPDARFSLEYRGSMDAIIRGTLDGVQLFLAVIGVIIVTFALVNLCDQVFAIMPDVRGAPLSLKRIMGWIFSPFMWLIGVPWKDANAAGALMGTKSIFNEYVAYLDFAKAPASAFSPRSRLIIAYALCSMADLASIGLLVSGIAALAPSRRAEIISLGFKSWIAGSLASLMTGAVIGLVTFGA